jgi:hypothetical protein
MTSAMGRDITRYKSQGVMSHQKHLQSPDEFVPRYNKRCGQIPIGNDEAYQPQTRADAQ